MTTTLTATQISDTAAELVWSTDGAPTVEWTVSRDVDGGGFSSVAVLPLGQLELISDFDSPAVGAVVTYRITDGSAIETDDADPLTWLEGVGTVNPLETAARYTTVSEVKERLRIPATNAALDARVLQAIVVAEYGIDAELGLSFPNAETAGVPVTITKAATSVAMQIYKSDDAPTGTAGGDSFYAELDLTELVRREIQSNPLLKGLRSSWGVA